MVLRDWEERFRLDADQRFGSHETKSRLQVPECKYFVVAAAGLPRGKRAIFGLRALMLPREKTAGETCSRQSILTLVLHKKLL